eukprot:CAMPEP_0172785236 /NCGR_PEP_ID=MMETSP1074-20121228/205341_1 /TAXON_ID=2916 /ORGANISM="Ceratium fusus, Strain PA161109" /LENGTH=75 /DNA_ID=CAMNT_0013622239 /DNA_START=631 /DNA_END=858 /DNA_ORIENTATION=-
MILPAVPMPFLGLYASFCASVSLKCIGMSPSLFAASNPPGSRMSTPSTKWNGILNVANTAEIAVLREVLVGRLRT